MTRVIYNVKAISLEATIMRVSREQAAENRERILDTAARLFRERGFDGIGVADLMKAAGLTHGGFYGHFASKDDLAAEACARTLENSAKVWDALIDASTEDPLAAIAASYLSSRHRDRAGDGCLFAALGSDVARQDPAIRHGVTKGMQDLLQRLEAVSPGKSKTARRQKALATFATMLGAVIMARATDDRRLSDEVLQAARAAINS
jgi:TetR/AcrR family transcriptional regulator, transcriptional repressor for nem operon